MLSGLSSTIRILAMLAALFGCHISTPFADPGQRGQSLEA
jgi:hypothetical protein